MLTDTQISNLAAAVNALRPDWPLKSLTTFIASSLQARAYRDTAVALAWVAADEQTKTPARVLGAGPWWKPSGEATDTYRPPRKDEQCPHHAGQYADSCHGCRADQLAGEARPPMPANLRRPEVPDLMQRLRDELASIKAGLCGHGYRGCKCRDQETEPTEPSNEETP